MSKKEGKGGKREGRKEADISCRFFLVCDTVFSERQY